MKAVVKYGELPGQVDYRDILEPICKDEDVKIEIRACAICMTDLHIVAATYPWKVGTPLGHEFCGVVVEAGKNVCKFKVGDRVVACMNGLQVLRYGGQLTQVGIFAKNATVDLGQLVYHDRSIVGSVAYDRETWMRTIRLVESARIDVKSFISETLPLSEWKRGFEKAAKREGFRILLLP